MDSSPGFGSRPSDLSALFGLAFAPAPAVTALALPLRSKSLAHNAKGTPSPLRAPTSLYVSHFRDYFIPLPGCFSPFPHGTIRYRSLHLFSLGWWSTQLQAGLHVSDPTQGTPTVFMHFVYGALTLYGRPFQAVRLCMNNRMSEPYNPAYKYAVWAVPGSLATTTGISKFDFFSSVTEMFQFTE